MSRHSVQKKICHFKGLHQKIRKNIHLPKDAKKLKRKLIKSDHKKGDKDDSRNKHNREYRQLKSQKLFL